MECKVKRFKSLSLMYTTLVLFLFVFTVELHAGPSLKVSKIISPQYEDAKIFSEDLLAVKKNGKWGYINKNGNKVIDFKYHIAYPFSEGKALVALEKLEKFDWSDGHIEVVYWGIIDKSGNFTNLRSSDGNLIYDFLEDMNESGVYTSYHNGVLVTDILDSPVNFLFDSGGLELEKGYGAYPLNEGILPIYDGKARFVDFNTGETLFKDRDFYDIRPFNQGLAPVSLNDGTGNVVWRFMNRNGEIIKDLNFADFKVQDMFGEYKIFGDNSLATIKNIHGKWGVIDKSGKTIMPFIYDDLKMFNEGLAGFKGNGKYGFIDKNGDVSIETIFDSVSSFNNGVAAVSVGNKAYLIDKEGNKIDGSDLISKSTYFKKLYYGDDINNYTVTPSEYVIIEENSKYGLGQLVDVDVATDEDSGDKDLDTGNEPIVSSQIKDIQSKSKANFVNNAKPSPYIKILVDDKEKNLTDPVIIDNGRVFLPVRALANILNIKVDYIEANKLAIAENNKAKLELPLGYNQAVKDMSIVLPIDKANESTRIISYNSRTYLPVRFISENLGFNIDYSNQTISIY